MAKPYLIFKAHTGFYYAQIRLADGTISNNKSTGCRNRTEAERKVMGWIVTGNIPVRVNSKDSKVQSIDKIRLFNDLRTAKFDSDDINNIIRILKERNFPLLSALTEKNIDVLEEISKLEELIPSIQNFKEWTKERCRDAQNTYRDSQLDPIVDMFVATFAKSNKAIKDGYDSQIKDYDHQLNGYTKETAYGKKHFFVLLR